MSLSDNFFLENLASKISDLQKEIAELKRASQFAYSDWINVNVSELSFASTNVLNTARDFTTAIGVGDKVKLIQSSQTKYFYVRKITSNQIFLTGGTNYVYNNSALTEFYYSDATPADHPGIFSYSPNMQYSISTPPLLTITDQQASFAVIDRICHVNIYYEYVANDPNYGPPVFISDVIGEPYGDLPLPIAQDAHIIGARLVIPQSEPAFTQPLPYILINSNERFAVFETTPSPIPNGTYKSYLSFFYVYDIN